MVDWFLAGLTGGLSLPYNYAYDLYENLSLGVTTPATDTQPQTYSLFEYKAPEETFGSQIGSGVKWLLLAGGAYLAFKYFTKK